MKKTQNRQDHLQAGLYNPYLDVLGGGEKLVLSLLKVLEDKGYSIQIFWDKNLKKEISERLNLNFNRIKFIPNLFNNKGMFLKRLNYLKQLDLFIYITDGSYFFSSAKKNYVFVMVPNKDLFRIRVINKLKLNNFKFICDSKFTQQWLNKWQIKAKIIYPYLSQEFFNNSKLKKENIILSVGRFFPQLHAKRQDKIIDSFKKIKQQNPLLKKLKLYLVGGLKEEDKPYFNSLQKLVGLRKDIILKTNISFTELLNLYQKAKIYWHFTGYGINEEKNPELVEHLGITPLEAMANECITYCFNAGGPKELIKDGFNGYLFNNYDELNRKMNQGLKDEKKQNSIKQKAKKFVKKNFSYKVFKKKIEEVILTEK